MRHVKLILRESIPSLGEAGDQIEVKVGFARNYLLPLRKAIRATEGRIREIEHHRRVVKENLAKEMQTFENLRHRLQSTPLEVSARIGAEGKLFGSVAPAQLAQLLAEKGFEIDRRKIAIDEPIKEAGEHRVSIRLHPDVIAQVAVTVRPED